MSLLVLMGPYGPNVSLCLLMPPYSSLWVLMLLYRSFCVLMRPLGFLLFLLHLYVSLIIFMRFFFFGYYESLLVLMRPYGSL